MSRALQAVGPQSLEIQDKQMAAVAQILQQSTPAAEIRYRPGKGGKQQAFVDHAYVTRLLNEAFGWDWDFEADNEEVLYFNDFPFEVRCRGKLRVRMSGREIVKMQYGCMQIEYRKDKQGNRIEPVTIGDAYKGAASDALKKCASLLGVALDLYDSDNEIHNTGKGGNNSGNARSANVPNKGQMIQQIKAAYIKSGGNDTDWPDYFKQKNINGMNEQELQALLGKFNTQEAA